MKRLDALRVVAVAALLVSIAALVIALQPQVEGAGIAGAGRSGNPSNVQPATELQNLVDCCQAQATIAEYQDNTASNQLMGSCTKEGIKTFQVGGLPALQSYIGGVCGGVCTTNADCNDGNSCTTELCSTNLGICIKGIPVGDGVPCQIGGQLGVCAGATCVPSGGTCITREECVEIGDAQPMESCPSGLACGTAAAIICICSS